MSQLFNLFLTCESGAVTTDWVVLTATIVSLAGASALLIQDGIVTAASNVGGAVEAREIQSAQ